MISFTSESGDNPEHRHETTDKLSVLNAPSEFTDLFKIMSVAIFQFENWLRQNLSKIDDIFGHEILICT